MRTFYSPFSSLFFTLLGLLGLAAHAHALTLESNSFRDGGPMKLAQAYDGWGSNGRNLSPQLSWSDVPTNTKSLAITMYDPDAPSGSGWWHWIVYNIPPTVSRLPEGATNTPQLLGGGQEGPTDYGQTGYGGPCPPPGDKPHHYIVTVWALDVEALPVPMNNGSSPTAAMIGFYIRQHQIAKSSITGLYSR